MKKPKEVIDAEAALSAKAAEVATAKNALKRLEGEYLAAHAAVRQAQTNADAALPQCRVVRVRWRTGVEDDLGRVVIQRRTLGGMLAVRPVGQLDDLGQQKFKFLEHVGRFRQVEKGGYTSDIRELREVPAEYLPTRPAA